LLPGRVETRSCGAAGRWILGISVCFFLG
jgi:hypothetical protein